MRDFANKTIFVSSTFRDMQAERDILRDVVLPQVNEHAALYGRSVELIDLRWGVDTAGVSEAEQNHKVLRTCFDEIERSRPFFIGILGARYGWVPPREDLLQALDMAESDGPESRIAPEEYAEKSVTALEMEYGALRAAPAPVCFFYLRKANYRALPRKLRPIYVDKGDACAKQKALKAEITRRFPARVRSYRAKVKGGEVTGLEAFANTVAKDIICGLTEEWGEPPAKAPAWQEEEARLLASVCRERTRGFAGRTQILGALREGCLGEGGPQLLLLQGVAGSGKSALLCKLMEELEEGCLLLPLACGISRQSSHVQGLLRCFIWRLCTFLGEEDASEKMTSFDELRDYFFTMLGTACQRTRVVAVVDALDQMEGGGEARRMLWVNGSLPKNFRLVCSIIDGPEMEAVKRMGGEVRPLAPLSMQEATEVIHALAARHHKQMPEEVIRHLCEKQAPDGDVAAQNPLYLSLMVQDLAMLDRYEHAQIDAYTAQGLSPMEAIVRFMVQRIDETPGDAEGAYLAVIARLARLIGEEFVNTVLELIAISRHGLRESDLAGAIAAMNKAGWTEMTFNPADFSWLRQMLGRQLVQGGALQWGFAHQSLPRALWATRESRLLHINQALTSHFWDIYLQDPMARRELMYHLYLADWPGPAARAIACQFDIPSFNDYAQGLAQIVLLQGEDTAPEEDFILMIIKAAEEEVEPENQWILGEAYLCNLYNALGSDASKAYHIAYLRRTLEMLQRTPGLDDNYYHQHTIMRCMDSLRIIYQSSMDDDNERIYAEAIAKMTQKLYAQNSENEEAADDYFSSMITKAKNLAEQGEAEQAEQHYKEGLAGLQALCNKNSSLERLSSLSYAWRMIGKFYWEQKRDDEALEALEKSLKIAQDVYEERKSMADLRYWALSAEALADFYHARGKIKEARRYLDIALGVWRQRYERTGEPEDLEEMSRRYESVGELLLSQEETRENPAMLEEALANFEQARVGYAAFFEKTKDIFALIAEIYTHILPSEYYQKVEADADAYFHHKAGAKLAFEQFPLAQNAVPRVQRGFLDTRSGYIGIVQEHGEHALAMIYAGIQVKNRRDLYAQSGEDEDLENLVNSYTTAISVCEEAGEQDMAASWRRTALPSLVEWAERCETLYQSTPGPEEAERLRLACDAAGHMLDALEREEEAQPYYTRAGELSE